MADPGSVTAGWDRLQDLFHLLEHEPEAERQRLLRLESLDEAVGERLRALLHAADAMADQLRATAVTGSEPARMLGPYQLLERIGAGGMGVVYLATRDVAGMPQRVALKLLLPQSSGPAFFDRFEREQRILASLDHPNITRLLDAGIDATGQPYLVMEHVAGQHLDVYCDGRALTVEQRLRLFLEVCDAVDYAHRNLVVHLDLKPSNILVTEEGTPKLLDFGTSKLVSNDGVLTTTLQATPSYASPEQLRNEAVTVACDVYSLGMILFELLAGTRAYADRSLAAMMERAHTEGALARLGQNLTAAAASKRGVSVSKLRSTLAGDLDTIAGACLRGNPRERYASVLSLREDLIRYLEGRPILVRPQTTLYQLRKFVTRNRSKVAIAAAVLVAVGVSAGLAWRSERQAALEGQRAVQMQTFLYRLLKTANSNYTGRPASTVNEFLALGIKMLPDYIKNPNDLDRAQLALAESVYWNSDYTNSARYFEQIAQAAHRHKDFDIEAQARAYTADIAYSLGRHEEALQKSAEALQISHQAGVSPAALALCARSYAIVRIDDGEHTEANRKLLEYSVEEAASHGLPAHDVGQYRYYLASELANEGRLNEAEDQFALAARLNNRDPLSMCDNVLLVYGLGQLRLKQNRNLEAAQLFEQAKGQFSTCYGNNDPDTVGAQVSAGVGLVLAGRAQEGEKELEDSLNSLSRMVPAGSRKLFEPLDGLALASLALKDVDKAERLSIRALAAVEGKVRAGDLRLGKGNLTRAKVLVAEGRYGEAKPHLEMATMIFKQAAATPEVERCLRESRSLSAAAR
jgi:serine/threonine protein kinase